MRYPNYITTQQPNIIPDTLCGLNAPKHLQELIIGH